MLKTLIQAQESLPQTPWHECVVNIYISHLISTGDFDQRVHLIQATAVFLPGHTIETDCICIFVGQKFDFTPQRHFQELI